VVVGEKLMSLKEKAHVSELDATSMVSINTFKLKVGDAPVDVLLNIAGKICPARRTTSPLTISIGVMAPKEQDSLTTTNHSVLEKTFAVNTYGNSSTTPEHIESVFSENREHGKLRNNGTALEFSDA
jgi:hypothetical protein